MEFARIKDLMERYSVSHTTIYRWIKTTGFPSPVKIGTSTARWPMDKVIAWEKERTVKTTKKGS